MIKTISTSITFESYSTAFHCQRQALAADHKLMIVLHAQRSRCLCSVSWRECFSSISSSPSGSSFNCSLFIITARFRLSRRQTIRFVFRSQLGGRAFRDGNCYACAILCFIFFSYALNRIIIISHFLVYSNYWHNMSPWIHAHVTWRVHLMGGFCIM